MSQSKVIEIARGELVVCESPPGSNRVKYWDEYDPKYQGKPEEWKPVKGYESRYEVSNFGRVRNRDGHILKPIERRGYLCLNFCVNGVRKDVKIHRLVAEAFIPNPNDLPFINHMDENKHNNCAENLEWCTAKYNCNYGTHNLRVSMSKTGKKSNWSAEGLEKLRRLHSIPIIGIDKLTGEIIRFPSAKDAEMHGFDRWCVQRATNGHMKTYRGYVWYKERDYEFASGY